MTRDQRTVAIGAASGVATMIIAMAGIYQIWPGNAGLADVTNRLAYALQANAFAAIPLLVGIMVVGNDRFLSEAIDPTLQKEDVATQINGRVVENTLQQFVLFLVSTTALSVNLTAAQMRIIPAAVIVFIVARTAFWIGTASIRSIAHLDGGHGLPECRTAYLRALESGIARLMTDHRLPMLTQAARRTSPTATPPLSAETP